MGKVFQFFMALIILGLCIGTFLSAIAFPIWMMVKLLR